MVVKTQSWKDSLTINQLSEAVKTLITEFICGNEVLDRFFKDEIYMCIKHHYVSGYYVTDKQTDDIVAVFTLAHDSVVIDNVDRDDFMSDSRGSISNEYIPFFEKQTSFPAINIGHLGVKKELQCQGIGGYIIDFVLYTYADEYTSSGCQFITVDSLNNPRTNNFYLKNGFYNQTNKDSTCKTRRMYLPIQLYSNSTDD